METNEISVHLYRVFAFARGNRKRWLTVLEVAAGAKVARRTAANHLLTLVKCGVLDQAEVFPGHRYRFSELASKRNRTFVERIERAGEVFSESKGA